MFGFWDSLLECSKYWMSSLALRRMFSQGADVTGFQIATLFAGNSLANRLLN